MANLSDTNELRCFVLEDIFKIAIYIMVEGETSQGLMEHIGVR